MTIRNWRKSRIKLNSSWTQLPLKGGQKGQRSLSITILNVPQSRSLFFLLVKPSNWYFSPTALSSHQKRHPSFEYKLLTMNFACRYKMNGFVRSYPDLLQPRTYHACVPFGNEESHFDFDYLTHSKLSRRATPPPPQSSCKTNNLLDQRIIIALI